MSESNSGPLKLFHFSILSEYLQYKSEYNDDKKSEGKDDLCTLVNTEVVFLLNAFPIHCVPRGLILRSFLNICSQLHDWQTPQSLSPLITSTLDSWAKWLAWQTYRHFTTLWSFSSEGCLLTDRIQPPPDLHSKEVVECNLQRMFFDIIQFTKLISFLRHLTLIHFVYVLSIFEPP